MSEQKVHVRFDNVQKSYDGKTLVVKKLNLDIFEGEFLTMLGPSGSGKTTNLMMLAGFETPTAGEIFVDGASINRLPPHKRGLGMVFQNYALFPHLSVRENLAFPLQVRKIAAAEIDQKIKRALDMVQLAEFADRRPAQLSGGQQQRVAVARALVFEPRLVLMDEPLGALDKNLREQMQYELKHIHETVGVTVVYVTHDQSEALTMSSRIAVFDDGQIQQLATPDDLYERPQNAFVAHFIGENNRLTAHIESVEDKLCRCRSGDGASILASPIEVKADEAVTLSLRPERVFVNPPADAAMPNVFPARVEELIYLGDHIRARLATLGHDDFIVKTPNTAGLGKLRIGEEIKIGWRTEDCRALKERA